MQNLIQYVESLHNSKRHTIPNFSAGDTVCVHVKIKEGNKERIQKYTGTVIQRRHKSGNGETFTVLKLVDNIAVERIFPILSPNIDKLEVIKRGDVRRARLFYFKELRGKNAKIKERKMMSKPDKDKKIKVEDNIASQPVHEGLDVYRVKAIDTMSPEIRDRIKGSKFAADDTIEP